MVYTFFSVKVSLKYCELRIALDKSSKYIRIIQLDSDKTTAPLLDTDSQFPHSFVSAIKAKRVVPDEEEGGENAAHRA